MGAYRNSRQLYQAMQLDADVQNCDNAIQKIEASFAAASQPVVRRFPVGVLGFVWRWVRWLWRIGTRWVEAVILGSPGDWKSRLHKQSPPARTEFGACPH